MVFGTNFSVDCISPRMFMVFVMTIGSPNVLQYENAIASCAALDAEYGFDGRIGSHSRCS